MCVLDKKITLYKKNITVYQLAGSLLYFTPNLSDVSLNEAPSKKYTWIANIYGNNYIYKWQKAGGRPDQRVFYVRYKTLYTTWISESHDGARIKYEAGMKKSKKFVSATATLHIGGKKF